MVPSPDDNPYNLPALSQWAQITNPLGAQGMPSLGALLTEDHARIVAFFSERAAQLGLTKHRRPSNGPDDRALRGEASILFNATGDDPLVMIAASDDAERNLMFAAIAQREAEQFTIPVNISTLPLPLRKLAQLGSTRLDADRVLLPQVILEPAETFQHPVYLIGYRFPGLPLTLKACPDVSLSPDAVAEAHTHLEAAGARVKQDSDRTEDGVVKALPASLLLRLCLVASQAVLPPDEQLVGLIDVEDVSHTDCVLRCLTGHLQEVAGMALLDRGRGLDTRRFLCFLGVRERDGEPFAHAQVA